METPAPQDEGEGKRPLAVEVLQEMQPASNPQSEVKKEGNVYIQSLGVLDVSCVSSYRNLAFTLHSSHHISAMSLGNMQCSNLI